MTAAAPLALLVVLLATDVWVYADACRHVEGGDPVVASIGPVDLDSPTRWAAACLVVWIVGMPLYLVARGHTG